jgi:tetratricopeptide (TPR) repeat protein
MQKMITSEVRKTKNHKTRTPEKQKQKTLWRPSNKALFIASAALVFAVILVYANSLDNDFVFDDKAIILDNRLLRSLSNIPKLLFASYRPVRDVTHALDFALWGENPAGFHVTNIIIHAANTLLVLFLVRRFTGELLPGVLAAMVFAVHPIQTDAVTYISGRRDILFTLFYLASFTVYLHYRKSRSVTSFALFILLWGLSLMSKEMAVTLPLLIFLWNYCDDWGETAGNWWRRALQTVRKVFSRDKWLYLPILLLVPAYIWYQAFIKGGSVLARDGFKYWGGSFYTNMLLSLRVQAWYLKQLVLPTPFVQYKGAFDISTTLLDWRVLLSIILVGAMLLTGFWALGRSKLIAFAILSYFVLLLPVSQIIPHHELLADHYLYLPMMSFALLLAVLVQQIAARGKISKPIAYGAAAVLVVVLALMTISRNQVWKDDFTLWQTNYKEVPNSIRAASSLAKAYSGANPGAAAELYKKCIEIDPSYGPAYYSLAVLSKRLSASMSLNDAHEYHREIERIIQVGLALPDAKVVSPNSEGPRQFRAQLTAALALTKWNQGEIEKGEQLLREAISLNPYLPSPYTLLAVYYRDTNPDKAVAILRQMVGAFSAEHEPLEQLSTLLIEYQRYDEAIPYLENLLQQMPRDFYANYQLSRVQAAKGECGKARTYLSVAQSAALSAEQQKEVQKAQSEVEQACTGG